MAHPVADKIGISIICPFKFVDTVQRKFGTGSKMRRRRLPVAWGHGCTGGGGRGIQCVGGQCVELNFPKPLKP